MVNRCYESLPFSWQGKAPETIQNDCRWLESIVRNAAPFSDWWVKARIVQMAYPLPVNRSQQQVCGSPMYAGLVSEQEIADALKSQCDAQQYAYCHTQLTKEYVIETLNCWRTQQFSQAVSRNFEVYVDRRFANVFLVTSTATVSLDVNRQLPPGDRYRPLFNVDELAATMHAVNAEQLTLRTHGYSTPAPSFYWLLANEADALNSPDPKTNTPTLKDNHLYVGFQWPSEEPVKSPGLWVDYGTHPGIVLKFLVVLGIIAGVVGTLFYLLLLLVQPVGWFWAFLTVFILWLIVFLLLRVVVYQRDRNRAVHYGAPDLAEFVWRLDAALNKPKNWSPNATEAEITRNLQRLLKVNLIGHSMGALVMVNMLRVLSDRFGKDDLKTLIPDSIAPVNEEVEKIGDHFQLDNLILTSPDIPLEFLREGRNNYVRSAMRRCRRIYLMSSDRDTVLRYLATVINWYSEPSIQMAGLRLGNVYLKRTQSSQSSFRPYVRIMLHAEAAIQPTSSYELFRKFNYLDCSQMQGDGGKGGVNSVPLSLNVLTALPIDFLNTILFLLGINSLDVHGGYFQTNTPSFRIIKFLLTANFLADEVVKAEIDQLIAGTPIRFLPSQPWTMPTTSNTFL
jgi:pimeloyl-ACP methyl ester carboxylesterase